MATTFYAFRKTLTTSGTPVQLDSLTVEPDQTALVRAKSTNAGTISIGNSSAEAIKTNDENFLLLPGESVELKVANTNQIWIDSTSSGDIVEVVIGGAVGAAASFDKPLASSTYSPSTYAPLTQVTKNVIKAATGNVLSTYITNDNATVRYFQLHNKASAPAAAEVPIYSFKVPAGTANNPGVLILDDVFWTKAGKNFTTGIGWAVSTTFGTFTDSATNTEHIVVVHYI